MSDQQLHKDGSSFTWDDDGQIYENPSSEIRDILQSESKSQSERAHFTSYSNMSDKNLLLIDNLYYTGNDAGYPVNNISDGYPQANTIFNTFDQTI